MRIFNTLLVFYLLLGLNSHSSIWRGGCETNKSIQTDELRPNPQLAWKIGNKFIGYITDHFDLKSGESIFDKYYYYSLENLIDKYDFEVGLNDEPMNFFCTIIPEDYYDENTSYSNEPEKLISHYYKYELIEDLTKQENNLNLNDELYNILLLSDNYFDEVRVIKTVHTWERDWFSNNSDPPQYGLTEIYLYGLKLLKNKIIVVPLKNIKTFCMNSGELVDCD